MRYSRCILASLLVASCFLTEISTGEQYFEKLQEMIATKKSFEEVSQFIRDLKPEELMQLGKAVSADPEWSQPASGIEYLTAIIMSVYADKISSDTETRSVATEIANPQCPKKWREQLISWYRDHAQKDDEKKEISDENIALFMKAILDIIKDQQEDANIRVCANRNLTILLRTRYATLLRQTGVGKESLAYSIFEEHIRYLLQLIDNPSLDLDLVEAAMLTLSRYADLKTPQVPDIHRRLLNLFKKRKELSKKTQVLLAELIVGAGFRASIEEELSALDKDITDLDLQRRVKRLLME